MNPCKNCKHYQDGTEFTDPCRSCTVFGDNGKPLKWEPITNADRIRAMTDEELAEWIVSVSLDVCPGGEPTDNNDYCTEHMTCKNCWLAWLREEVDND